MCDLSWYRAPVEDVVILPIFASIFAVMVVFAIFVDLCGEMAIFAIFVDLCGDGILALFYYYYYYYYMFRGDFAIYRDGKQ